MKHIRSLLLVFFGIVIGLPIGWCLRGRHVAAQEAFYHNLLEIEKAKQQWAAETETNRSTEGKP